MSSFHEKFLTRVNVAQFLRASDFPYVPTLYYQEVEFVFMTAHAQNIDVDILHNLGLLTKPLGTILTSTLKEQQTTNTIIFGLLFT